MLRREARPRRNERCFCGSGKKYKYCCSNHATSQPQSRNAQPADYGEVPVRFVITDSMGTSFFSTKDGKVMVFTTRAVADAVAHMSEFDDQVPGEINVVGVGETKWKFFQERLPVVEFSEDMQAEAQQCIRDKIAFALEQHESADGEPEDETPAEDTAAEEK